MTSRAGSSALSFLQDDDGRFAIACAIWGVALVTIAALLPALPVDETRYLSVAWEMHQSGNWLLPTLDGLPYSHKPPLLFWLINLAWSVTGENVMAARLVSVVAAMGMVALTFRLGRELVPAQARLATVLLVATPAILFYGPLIMFDLLLGVAVLLALISLWRLAQDPTPANTALLGAAIGFGLMAKGPVILLHVLPPAILIRYWRPTAAAVRGGGWALRIAAAVGIGVLVGLAWAIPAAISGGPEFAEMIFWKQSAGRMVSSFAHKRPFWFFVPVMAAFLLPFFLWQPFWRAAGRLNIKAPTPAQAFLISWIGPAFVIFSAMSGKQPHYMLPLVPGVTLLLASLMDEAEGSRPGDTRAIAALFVVLAGAMLLLPFALVMFAKDTPTKFIAHGIGAFNPLITLAGFAAGAAALYKVPRSVLGQASSIAIAGSVLMLTLVVQCQLGVMRYYDLRPLAQALRPFETGPVAAATRYAGEVSFMTRLTTPVQQISKKDLPAWFAAHPGGVALFRYSGRAPNYEVVFSQPYRRKDYFAIIRAKR
jgi:4-amino-4-deoxy-L-arabinose transferase-like glycosyltransferase